MEKNQEANNQLAVINNSIEVFKTAPLVLTTNRDRASKALEVGVDIISKWKVAWDIPDEDARMIALSEIDQRSLKYVVNCSTAVDEMKQQRAAITQLMDNFKSMFTETENVIDKTKAGTPSNSIQVERNKYAAAVTTITIRKQKEADDKANNAKEFIDLKSEIEKKLFEKYTNFLVSKKLARTKFFDEMTLDNFLDRKCKIESATNEFVIDSFDYSLSIYGKYHTNVEINRMIDEIYLENQKEYINNYKAELTLQQEELIDLFPSKINELKKRKEDDDKAADLKKLQEQEADENKKIALQKQQYDLKAKQDKEKEEQKQREEEAKNKITETAAASIESNEQSVNLTAQGEKTMVEFEKEVSIQSSAPVIKTKISLVINVLHVIGYTQIFQLWYDREGKNLTVEKFANTKVEQMKSFCEKIANKESTKIESKYLEYVEDIKAISRKTKEKESA